MAVKYVDILLGQSNQEGVADKLLLPASLRGVQANTWIFNYEANAIQLLNCDGAGANLPNNNTSHTAGLVGPEMSYCASAVAELGEIYVFKYAIGSSGLGPMQAGLSWNLESLQLFPQLAIRWAAYLVRMGILGHTVVVRSIHWYQGETDATIDGNDEAYLGLFKRFIRDVRSLVQPDASLQSQIKWVTHLISNKVLNSLFINRNRQLNNVRAALYKAGWSDPNYRVVETNSFSHDPNQPEHLDTEGVQADGIAGWAAVNLPYNNSMALEDYDLISLRERLAEEFGIDLSIAENKVTIDKRINDAIAWIMNRRKNWPWSERDTSIDVGERTTAIEATRYAAGVFSRYQNYATLCTYKQSVLEPREIVDFGGSGLEGMLVTDVTGNLATPYSTITFRHGYTGDDQQCTILSLVVGNPTVITVSLDTAQGGTAVIPDQVTTFGVVIADTSHSLGNYNGSHYATRISDNSFSIPVNSTGHVGIVLGTAKLAKQFTIAQGYFELPEDFIRNFVLNTEGSATENKMIYRHPSLLEREIRDNKLATSLNRLYTAVVDPLNISSRKFILVFPYFTGRNVLHVKYWGDAKKLIADADVPDIPRSDRFVLFYAASWFVAQWQKDTDMVSFYRDGALNELERMTKEYQLSDDITENEDADDYYGGPVRGPEGFPEFQEP